MAKFSITGKRLLAIALMLMLAATFLTGCNNSDDAGATTGASTTAADIQTTQPDESAAPTEADTAPTEDLTGSDLSTGTDVSSEDVSATDAPTDPATTLDGSTATTLSTASTASAVVTTTKPGLPQIPTGKKDILAAYTAVVDKVKVDQPEYKNNDWQTMSNIDINGVLYGIVSLAANSFLETKEQSSEGTQQKGSHPKWFAMPTDTHKVGCVLTDTTKITSANCVKKGDYYVITIALEPEKDPVRDMSNPYNTKGWTGKMFDVIEIAEVMAEAQKIPGLNTDNAYCTFQGTATLTYDPVTNRCVKLDHIIDVRVYLGAKSAKVIADYHFYDFKW